MVANCPEITLYDQESDGGYVAWRSATAAGGLGMQTEQERVEDSIVTADAGGGVDLLELPPAEGTAGVG
jgi:hypothetical protein